jgi:hypothetical protein
MADVRVIEEFNHFAQYAEGMDVTAHQAVKTTIHRIEARSKQSLSGPRHGRIYRRGAKGRILHRASAPGEAPGTDTGHLANSIGARMTRRTEGEITVTADYAAVLELGGAHLAPRPFFNPAVQAEWPEFVRALEQVGVR